MAAPLPRLVTVVLVLTVASGCVSHVARLEPVRAAFHRGDLAEAERLLARDAAAHPEDGSAIALDRATVVLAAGRPAEAERILRDVRDEFDRLEGVDPTAGVMVLARDDVAAGYPGEDHEKVLVRALLAVANLLQDGDDAEAYALQVAAKQREIVLAAAGTDGTNPKAVYPQVAFGSWLRGTIREATHRDYDDAARSYAELVSWQPEFPRGTELVARARGGRHSTRGHGVVHVIAMVGHGPFKADVVEVPSTLSLAIAGDLLAGPFAGTLPAVAAPVRVPRLVVAAGRAAAVDVAVDGTAAGRSETVTSVSRLALAQHEAVLPTIVARAVARRALKSGAVFGVNQGLGLEGTLPGVAVDLAGVAWQASEKPDTRCWGLLPDSIQVLRVELPEGPHRLSLTAVDGAGHVFGDGCSLPVNVADGRNTYCLVHATDAGIIGTPLADAAPPGGHGPAESSAGR
ncbi:MAG: hypothetical protein EBR86_03475 [Planctomycetia bacterium]|nr:hypothetical protein [Planctomycetia bacterium]